MTELMTATEVAQVEKAVDTAQVENKTATKAEVKNACQIIALLYLVSKGKKIGRLEGNRDLDPKAVKSKKVSLKENGQLIPAVIVDATDALEAGLVVIDFKSGELITDEDASEYVVLVDANHRYQAYLELLEEDKDYTGEFYLMYPLNLQISIAKMLAVINTETNVWKGKDFGKGAGLLCGDILQLLEAINELTAKGYSLDAAVKWLTFNNKVNKKILADAMNGKINDCLRFTTGIERGMVLLDAVKTSMGENLPKTRTIPDWIIAKYDKAEDSNKVSIVNSIEGFFRSINSDDAKMIKDAKGKRGESTKEQIIYTALDKMFEAYLYKKGESEKAA